MNTKWKRLAAVLWLSTVVLATWVGVYAAKNDASFTGAFDKSRHQMMQQLGSGEMIRPPRMDWFNPEEWMPKWGKENRFWFAFIDEESLTDTQKEEIEKLQKERDEAIKKINDEFFDKLEKFISEEKLDDYENFVENHENMKWMNRWMWHGKWNPKMKWDHQMKNIQKPKNANEE